MRLTITVQRLSLKGQVKHQPCLHMINLHMNGHTIRLKYELRWCLQFNDPTVSISHLISNCPFSYYCQSRGVTHCPDDLFPWHYHVLLTRPVCLPVPLGLDRRNVLLSIYICYGYLLKCYPKFSLRLYFQLSSLSVYKHLVSPHLSCLFETSTILFTVKSSTVCSKHKLKWLWHHR